jgi:hypothetical protein
MSCCNKLSFGLDVRLEVGMMTGSESGGLRNLFISPCPFQTLAAHPTELMISRHIRCPNTPLSDPTYFRACPPLLPSQLEKVNYDNIGTVKNTVDGMFVLTPTPASGHARMITWRLHSCTALFAIPQTYADVRRCGSAELVLLEKSEAVVGKQTHTLGEISPETSV